MQVWSKTILGVYKYLDKFKNAVDNLVDTNVSNSSFYCKGKSESAFDITNRIIELIERKKKIIKLHQIINETLNRLSNVENRILTLCYLDQATSTDIANAMNISLRTFFRKKYFAIQSFGKVLSLLGYNVEFFDKFYATERWLYNIYLDNLIKFNDSTISDIENIKIKKVINDLSFINKNSYVY